MSRMPVFGTPSPPEQWVSEDIVRIVDPLGTAVAWVAPALAGACIGFCIKDPATNEWYPFVRSQAPPALDPEDVLGIEAMFSGSNGAIRPARITGTGWAMRERDPTSVSIRGLGDLREHHATVRCDARALEMRLTGTSFAGFRMHLISSTKAGDHAAWHGDQAGRLVVENGDRQILVMPSPTLGQVTDPEPRDGGHALRVDFYLIGQRAFGEPLIIRISDRTSTIRSRAGTE